MTRPTPEPSTLAGLVAGRLLDASVAATAGLMLEHGVPVLAAGNDAPSRAALIDALVDALPAERRPDAEVPGKTGRLVRVGSTLTAGTTPGLLRAALGVTTGQSGLVAAVEAHDLAGVLDVLALQGMTDEETSFLGVVLVVAGRPEGADGPRVVAAHYLRPVVRDAGGHPRLLGPAVLATWNPAAGDWDDFAWGIAPDLAERCRMRVGDFEAERARRRDMLTGHANARPVG